MWSSATSHAPTIGRKRRYSLTDRDASDSPSSTAKRTKNDLVKPDIECDAVSEGESINGPVEQRDVKEVTKGVKEVDLEDKDKAEDSSSIRPEGIPLPDSPLPSPSPEPESEPPELARSEVLEAAKDEAGGEDSVASSLPQDDAEEGAGDRTEAESITTNADTSAHEVTVPTVESDLHDTPETLEANE